MNQHYNVSGNQQSCFHNECNNSCSCKENKCGDCDKFKEKADELYEKASCIQEEYKRLVWEARELDSQSKEFERKAKQLCLQANIVQEQAMKLESEANSILDLGSFYCKKAAECAKNQFACSGYSPSCGSKGDNCNCR